MAVKPIYAAGLDAGSRQTRLVICVLENSRIRFVGASAVESQGWAKGRIADQQAVAESITAALREADSSAAGALQSVVVGMGGPTVRGANGRGVLELGYVQEIQQSDVRRVIERASRVQLMEDRMVLQLFPQDFVVDDHPGHRDPRKMLASRLEINVHLVTASIQEHNAIIGAVNAAHLAVEESVYEALAACYAAVLPENRREGIAVVDIGAQSTELVIYYGDAMHLASTVRICGDHFTRDLAQGLCLSFEDAELVKMEFGCALLQELSRECPGGTAHPRRSPAARSAAPHRQPHSGGPHRRAVPLRTRRIRARRHGTRAHRRRLPHRRRRQIARPVRCRRGDPPMPDALRSHRRHSGLAARIERPRVVYRRGSRDVFRKIEATRRAAKGTCNLDRKNVEVRR